MKEPTLNTSTGFYEIVEIKVKYHPFGTLLWPQESNNRVFIPVQITELWFNPK